MFGSFLIIYSIPVSANLCCVDHLKSLDCHDIAEILLKVALNTINQTESLDNYVVFCNMNYTTEYYQSWI
jgi:hypothetical protein